MNDFIKALEIEFEKHANDEIARGQKAYMKNRFDFYGIKSPLRREIQKPFLMKKYLPPKSFLEETVKILWEKPQREYQYFSQEFAFKYVDQPEKNDVELIEYMITHKSWWDTVDFIAAKLAGAYFKNYPEQRELFVEKWLDSGNIWLQRTSLLFQLNYKDDLDKEMLSYVINALLGSKEFFINKAIGWILRQYGKTNPEWVIAFTNATPLSNLSRKEALRLIS